MMMKKILLTLVMALAFTACGEPNTPDTPDSPDTPDTPSTEIPQELLGAWHGTTMDYYQDDVVLMSQDVTMFYEAYDWSFNADGTGSMTMGSAALGIETTTTDFTFEVKDADGTKVLYFTINDNGTTLTQEYVVKTLTSTALAIVVPEMENDANEDDGHVYTQVVNFAK